MFYAGTPARVYKSTISHGAGPRANSVGFGGASYNHHCIYLPEINSKILVSLQPIQFYRFGNDTKFRTEHFDFWNITAVPAPGSVETMTALLKMAYVKLYHIMETKAAELLREIQRNTDLTIGRKTVIGVLTKVKPTDSTNLVENPRVGMAYIKALFHDKHLMHVWIRNFREKIIQKHVNVLLINEVFNAINGINKESRIKFTKWFNEATPAERAPYVSMLRTFESIFRSRVTKREITFKDHGHFDINVIQIGHILHQFEDLTCLAEKIPYLTTEFKLLQLSKEIATSVR